MLNKLSFFLRLFVFLAPLAEWLRKHGLAPMVEEIAWQFQMVIESDLNLVEPTGKLVKAFNEDAVLRLAQRQWAYALLMPGKWLDWEAEADAEDWDDDVWR